MTTAKNEKFLKHFQKCSPYRMGDSNRQNHHNDRYSSRQYQPYVFRPNFMKNTDGQTKQYGRKVIDWTGSCAQTIISRRFKATEILI